MNYCKDCKHFIPRAIPMGFLPPPEALWERCGKVRDVIGKPMPCILARAPLPPSETNCGTGGAYWEPVPKKEYPNAVKFIDRLLNRLRKSTT